jgi:glycosyltransferase involved in cell wall biosynthesis
MVPKILPKVLIDARMVSPVQHGISRYVTSLARGLSEFKVPYQPIFLRGSSDLPSEFSVFEQIQARSRFLSLSELWELPRLLRKSGAALYHSPSFSSLWSCPCPSIVTIHDLNHLTYGSWDKKLYYQVFLKRFARCSRAVVTVSEFSRREISEWLDLIPEYIHVVYNSVEPLQGEMDESRFRSLSLQSKQYFFCLSNPKPHKNIALMIEAYGRFREQQKNCWPLVLTLNSAELKSLAGANPPGVIATGSLSDSGVRTLLTHTGGMVFPSLYEGFGLPPVEAAISGVPLAVSNIPPHKEGLIDLAAHEAHWVNPRDFHGWIQAFHRLMKGEISPPSSASQEKILARFSAKKMAQSMDQVYRHVLGLSE